MDVSGLVLSGYRIKRYEIKPPKGNTIEEPMPVKPLSSGSNGQGNPSTLDYLREIIQKMSDTFGEVASEDDIVQFINHLVEQLSQDEELLAQIRNNPFSIAKQGKLPESVKMAIIRALNSYRNLAELLLKNSDTSFEQVLEMIYQVMRKKILQ